MFLSGIQEIIDENKQTEPIYNPNLVFNTIYYGWPISSVYNLYNLGSPVSMMMVFTINMT